ncbi:TPA: DUF4145 domain-containing protein [Escherichia coli]
MLTAIDVPEHNDKNKCFYLHQRIELFDGHIPPYKNTLMAIKFLGNVGSHTNDEVTTGDIEAAFEIMEYVVNDLFFGLRSRLPSLPDGCITSSEISEVPGSTRLWVAVAVFREAG